MPADIQIVLTTSTSIYTGRGILAGLVASTTAATGGVLTIYDETTPRTPIFQATVKPTDPPLILFFADRFAPRFNTGCLVDISGTLYVNVWAAAR